MNAVALIARILLGLVFVVFGLNGFFHFIPMPEMNDTAGQFFGALTAGSYLKVVKVLEIVGGALLLLGRTSLGLVILTPIVANILLFHLFIEPSGMGMAAGITALNLFLIWTKRDVIAEIVKG